MAADRDNRLEHMLLFTWWLTEHGYVSAKDTDRLIDKITDDPFGYGSGIDVNTLDLALMFAH